MVTRSTSRIDIQACVLYSPWSRRVSMFQSLISCQTSLRKRLSEPRPRLSCRDVALNSNNSSIVSWKTRRSWEHKGTSSCSTSWITHQMTSHAKLCSSTFSSERTRMYNSRLRNQHPPLMWMWANPYRWFLGVVKMVHRLLSKNRWKWDRVPRLLSRRVIFIFLYICFRHWLETFRRRMQKHCQWDRQPLHWFGSRRSWDWLWCRSIASKTRTL